MNDWRARLLVAAPSQTNRLESKMTKHYREMAPVWGVIPFAGDDGADEAEMAAIEGVKVTAMRVRRRKGVATPWTKSGKRIIYSKILRLKHLHEQMQQPLRKTA
ncbi:MAG TPA: hypothetical protein VF869_05550 [Jatrophihabitantaceae bacterium]